MVNAELATRDITSKYDGTVALFAGATPDAVIAAATSAANALADVIKQRKLFTRIGTRDHVQIEGWQTLGALTGVFALKDGGVTRLPWPKLAAIPDEPPDPGQEPRNRSTPEWEAWKAATDARDRWQHVVDLHDAKDAGLTYGFTAAFYADKDGRQIGWGEGRCERSESTWTSRNDYVLSSMAQTRGQSRALAAPLRFVVELAGYASTPAEEMPPVDVDVDALVAERVQAAVAEAVAAAQTPPPPLALLDQEGELEVAHELQQTWPNIDAYGFLVFLMKRLGTEGLPEYAGRALKGWAWWQRQPQATGSIRAQDEARAQDARDVLSAQDVAPQPGDTVTVAEPNQE